MCLNEIQKQEEKSEGGGGGDDDDEREWILKSRKKARNIEKRMDSGGERGSAVCIWYVKRCVTSLVVVVVIVVGFAYT